MKRILLTGGAGFIGTNLTQALLAQGHEVYSVDNFITGKRANIEKFAGVPGYQFFELDITAPDFPAAFAEVELNEIFHLACPTGVPNIQKLSEEMILTCSLGTLQVLEIARKFGSKVVYSSSSEIYGDPEVFPQSECYTGNVDPIGQRSPYEEGKRFSESIVMMYVRKYGLPARIVRFFNVYGPNMSLEDKRVIPQFLASARNNQPFVIYGDGKQKRTLLYVEDLLRGLMLVMNEGQAGEVYNIGSDKELSIEELARVIIAHTHHQAGIDFQPHFIDDHKRRMPDLTKIKSFGWEQTVDLDDGVKRMLATYGW